MSALRKRTTLAHDIVKRADTSRQAHQRTGRRGLARQKRSNR
jgi:hypothetical protein